MSSRYMEELAEAVQTMLGDGYSAEVHESKKNNGNIRAGIMIRKHGLNICPVIYPKNEPLTKAAEHLAETYRSEEASLMEGVLVKAMKEKMENLPAHVLPKLVNKEKNRGLLENCPHADFLDLAVIYYVNVTDYATVTIQNRHAEAYGYGYGQGFDELHMASIENLRKKGYRIRDLGDVISEFLGPGRDAEEGLALPRMACMSVPDLNFGAPTVMLEDANRAMALKLGGSYYILPSSVHEIIAVPCGELGDTSVSALRDLVATVNGTAVEEEEYLSGSVYLYEPGKGISIAKEGGGR